jgi:Tfp pilus assembly protein PilO
MIRFIFPTILIIASIVIFVGYTNQNYKEMKELKTLQASYNDALSNSRKLLEVKGALTEKYNSLSDDDRDRLMKLMPDNVENIKLILDIQKIASQYGMLPRDVKFDTVAQVQKDGPLTPQQAQDQNKPYGSFDLEFSVSGTYGNFLSFLRDLEKSLRLVDIISVSFSSSEGGSSVYKYTFKIRTYWLKS